MCLIVAANLGAATLVATDRRWRFSEPGQPVRYEDRGGKLVEVPGGWMAVSGSGRRALAALEAASACSSEPEIGPAIRAATEGLPGRAFCIGATAGHIHAWTADADQQGGPGAIAAKGAVGGRSDEEVVAALEDGLRLVTDLQGAIAVVRGLFATEAAITRTVSPECDIGIVYPDGRRLKL